MNVSLKEWARRHFREPVSISTLIAYAKTGQISPEPFKFGGRWVVDENARYVGLCPPPSSTDPLVMRILNHGQKAQT